MNYPSQRDRDNIAVLGLLSFAYFVVELIINYSIYQQLSHYSNLMAIDALEFWGKIVTGLGMALIITRFVSVRSAQGGSHESSPNLMKVFRNLCVICIPLSFFLQNQIINKIVESSTPDMQNRALLVANTQKTIVPYYDFSNTSSSQSVVVLQPHEKLLYPFNSKANSAFNNVHKDYYEYQHYYRIANEGCLPDSREALGMQSGVDRAFFAYAALKTAPQNAFKYKAAIKKHYECLFETRAFVRTHTKNMPYKRSVLVDMYEDHFVPGSIQWHEATRHSKASADRVWRASANDLFGFKTTIKPYASTDDDARLLYFVNHPDVRRFYNKIGPDAESLYPYDDGFEEKQVAFIMKNLLESLMPNYSDYIASADSEGGYILAEVPIGGANDDPNVDPSEAGKSAYKAVVMPMVAMGLSAFFLVFNVVLFVFSIIRRRVSSTAAALYLLAVVILSTIYPILPAVSSLNDNILMHDQSLKAQWLYHQETMLSKLYDLYNMLTRQ